MEKEGGGRRKKHVKRSYGGRGSGKEDKEETQAVKVVRQRERSRNDWWNEVTNGTPRPVKIMTPANLILNICTI